MCETACAPRYGSSCPIPVARLLTGFDLGRRKVDSTKVSLLSRCQSAQDECAARSEDDGGESVRITLELGKECADTTSDFVPEGHPPPRERPTHHSRFHRDQATAAPSGSLKACNGISFVRRESWNVICCLLASGESLVLREYPSDESRRVLLRRTS